MFGRTRPGNVEYDVAQFSSMCKALQGHQLLQRTIGSAKTQALVLVLHKNYHVVSAQQASTFPQLIDSLFMKEAEQLRNRAHYVSSLLDQANAGRLRARLANAVEPATNYSTVSGAGGDRTVGGEIRNFGLAYDWAAKSWRGAGRESIMATLLHYAKQPDRGSPLGYDTGVIDDAYARVVRSPPPYRGPNPAPKYPSSFGGRFLLDFIFKLTAGLRWPARGDGKWDDYALFYLGAIVAVQGFTDGNKRVGKLAYAITLLRSGRSFRAPTIQLENDLYQLET